MSNAQTHHLSYSLAPWADVVPDTGPAKVDDLLAQPDDGWRYEVVEGVLVRVAGSGDLATAIALLVGSLLLAYVRPRRLGRVTGADGVYRFPNAETGLLPDVGYYGAALVPRIADRDKPIPFAPELAIEVASASQDRADMAAKVQRYLQGGTRLVWVVWPHARTVDVWRPADLQPRYADMHPSSTLRAAGGDLLDGEDVVPGFTQPVADIFDV
jgi:Uma2 family endonuclease